ncbi:MAG: carbohydrate kinase family protein [Candidatus Kaiserbacteria bacterium]|nr:carbohydrate kinase family protein [Candidatus Kaiserbacteria bacterium]
MQNASFITLGDVTNDAFIKLQEASVHCDISTEQCTISMRWGDKIPYEDVVVVPAVGNSANAAVSAARLGLPTAFISFVGDDRNGKECIAVLQDENIDTQYITEEPGKKTNYHYVLSYEAERTILVRHEHFTYSLPNIPDSTEWLYCSSVGEAAKTLHDEVVQWIKQHPETKLVFQPGTFQMQLGYDYLKDLYAHTHLFICNKQEAQRILKTEETNIKTLLQDMHSKGPTIAIITDGPNGAYAYNGDTTYFVPQYPDIAPPKERTGAGDAFSSTLAAFLAKGLPLKEALLRAPINSMSVVQHIGAQKGLLTEKDIEHYLQKAPESYTVATV